jgi:ABC-type dipeptide/oligopeptide/nickel transport system ATPase component
MSREELKMVRANPEPRTLNPEPILQVKDLQIHFHTDRGVIRAVEGVDFAVRKQEVWGLVGESASGKSVIGQALVGVVAKPAGRIVSGEILFKGEDILRKDPKEVQKIRGNQIAVSWAN